MPTVPEDAVKAAAEVLLRQYATEYSADHLTWKDFTDPAREVLEAAAPVLAGHAAQAITAHMEAHAPKDGAARRKWRRHLGIAARVAALAFSTDADLKHAAAEHLDKAAAVQRAREEISVVILAQKELCREPGHAMFPRPSCWTCGRNGAFHRAAMIAKGMRPDQAAKAAEGTAPA